MTVLTRIRERASGWIAWAIVILISVPFALWGVNSYFEGASKVVVATADGIEIDQESYQQALTQQQRTLVQLSGQDFNPEFFSSDEFKRQVVDQLIDQTLQTDYVQSRGYHISDYELNLRIQAIPAFLIDGSFDAQRYRDLLSRAGFSVAGFEEQQRREATFNQVENSIVDTAIAPKISTDNLIKLLLEKRKARYVILELSDYADEVILTEQDVEDSYRENRNSYFRPAEIQVDYVILSVDEIAQGVVLDEQQVRSVYDADIDQFVQPESRFVRHILVEIDENGVEVAREKANDIVSRIQGGDDFVKVAEEMSDDTGSARRGGDLGVIQLGAMPSAFEKAASDLSVNEISEPIQTEYGFHIIQVYNLIPETRKAYKEVYEQIAADLRRTEAETRFVEMSEDFRNISYEQADSLGPLAEALDAEIRKSNWFSRDRGEDLFGDSTLRQAAFVDSVLVDNLNSDVVEVDLDTLVVMRKAAYREERPQALSEVRTTVADDLRLKTALSKLELDGDAIVEEMRLGDVLWSKAIADRGWTERTFPSTEENQDQLMDVSLRALIYSAPPPIKGGKSSYGSGWIDESSFLIYELTAVIDGDISVASDAEREQMRSLVLRRNGVDMLGDLEQRLRAVADVEIHPSQL